MLPLNKVEFISYRYAGLIGSSFTLFQSIIWFALSCTGAICQYTACGSNNSKDSFSHSFYLMYFYEPQDATDNFNKMNFVSPISFNILMWINVLLSIAIFVISLTTMKEFKSWTDAKQIKLMAKIWPICILCFSCIELVMFSIFIYDIVCIQSKKDEKCSIKTNLDIFQSSYTNERNPAPFLIQLKSNLQRMRQKIKRLKKKLQFLNVLVDTKNPDYLKNPFISEKLVSDYVEKVWKNMFNSNIRETVPNKTNIIPSDEMLKNFVLSENIQLDALDEDLVKNFDGLTIDKFVKPRRDNVVFGKQFELSPSITLETPNVTDDLVNLLLLYFKQTDKQSANYIKRNINCEDLKNRNSSRWMYKQINERSEFENATVQNDNPKRKNYDNKEFFSKLIELIYCLAFEEQNLTDDEESNQNDKIMQILEFFEKYDKKDMDAQDVFNNIMQLVNGKYELNKDEEQNLGRRMPIIKINNIVEEIYNTTDPKKLKQKPLAIKYRFIEEIDENCSPHILGPSILCMAMVLKFGLIWLTNIILAILTLHYDSKIKIIRAKRNSFIFE